MWNNAPLLPAGQNANPVPPRRYQITNLANTSLYDIREVMKTGDFKFAIPLLTRYLEFCQENEKRREALFWLVVCLYAEFEYLEAREHMIELLTTYPNHTNLELQWNKKIRERLEMHKNDELQLQRQPIPLRQIQSRYAGAQYVGTRYAGSNDGGMYVSRRRPAPAQLAYEPNGNTRQSLPGYEREDWDDDEPIL